MVDEIKKREIQTSKLPNLRLAAVAFVVSFGGSFNFGYQLVLTNPSQETFLAFVNASLQKQQLLVVTNQSNFFENSSLAANQITDQFLETLWGAIVASLCFGCLFGSALLPLVIDNLGRKPGLWISTTVQMIACLLTVLSKALASVLLFTLARLLFGLALGLALGTASIYLAEISPKQCRGRVSMFTGMLLQSGLVLASVLAMPSVLGNANSWHYLYWIELIPLSCLAVCLPQLDETPSFLASKNRPDLALVAIRNFHACSTERARFELAEICLVQNYCRPPVLLMKNSSGTPEKKSGTNVKKKSGSARVWSIFDVLKMSETRRAALVGCTVALGLGFTGIVVINAFAVDILKSAGLSTFQASLSNVGLGMVCIFGSVASTFVIDCFGRRPILLALNASLILLNLAIFALMRMFEIRGERWIGVTLVCVIAVQLLAFSMGPGPISFFISSEMVDHRARSAAQSLASMAQMTCRTLILAIYLPLQLSFGSFAYLLLFVCPLTIGALILFFYLPETKNRNVQEVKQSIDKLPTLNKIASKVSMISMRTQAKLSAGSNVTEALSINAHPSLASMANVISCQVNRD